MKKAGIIGLGDISVIHMAALEKNKNIEVVSVCDINSGLKNKYEKYRFYEDYVEMMEKEELDCIHICLPHYLHYEVTRRIAEKGINVFLEKPVGLDLNEAEKLLKVERENKNVKICVCLQNRLNATFIKLTEILQSKEYGEVRGIKGLVTWSRKDDYYNVKPWRKQMKYAGGGVMINQTVHTLDLMQLIGGKVSKIKGLTTNLDEHDSGFEVEDTAIARITFDDNVEGIYFATVAYTENSSVELQVITEKAKFTIKDSFLTISSEGNRKEEIIEDDRVEGTKFYYGASHEKLINQFYQCLEEDSQNYIHVEDSIPSMEIIEVIKKKRII